MQTNRLILRPLRDTDLDDVLGLYNTPEVSKGYAGNISQKKPQFKDTVRFITMVASLEDDGAIITQLKSIAEGSAFHAIITLKDTGEFVGECALRMNGWARNRNACFTIGMMPQYQGKGYGKEASKYVVDYGFRWLGLHRVTIEVFGSNTAAIALYESM